MIRKIYISIVTYLTIFTAFSYGQSSDLGAVCAESRQAYGVEGYPNSTYTWAIEGGIIIEGEGEDTVLIQWGYDVGDYQMEVIELTSSNCVGAPVTANISVQAPEVDLGFDFYEICDGDSISFDASGNYDEPATFLWHSGATNDTYVADTTENIWVRVTDQLGCVRYDSMEFVAHRLPVVDLGNDTLICDDINPLELDAGDFAAYEWVTNTEEFIGNPIYVYPNSYTTDTIRVLVTDVNNCTASDTMYVFPCDAATLFDDMYNTFTPNDDGDNDTWIIIDNMSQFPDAVLEVFDRWGRLVYRTTNVASEPWDGRSNGREMPMDAYFFVLELNYSNFEAITGTVNLIR